MKEKSAGFSMVEVLIAWFILSCCAMTLLHSQREISQTLQKNYYYMRAAFEVQNLLERLRACQHDASLQNYEFAIWNQEVREYLPQGQGNYRCSNSSCQVNVQWKNKTIQKISLDSLL